MKKFKESDVFHSVTITNPLVEFLIYTGSVFYQHRKSDNSNVPNGSLSLYELNVNRTGNKIYPFAVKSANLDSFKQISTDSFNSASYGDVFTGTYEYTSSLSRDFYSQNQDRTRLNALKNTLNSYTPNSKLFQYANCQTTSLALLSLPSIFYGSKINPGSLELDFYVTGTLCAKAQDIHRNGVLVQTYGNLSGSAIGLVLYSEGFIVLNNTQSLNNSATDYYDEGYQHPSWNYFGFSNVATVDSSFKIKMQGTQEIPIVTMFAHVERVDLNHSNNPTFVKYGQNASPTTGSKCYKENESLQVKNLISSSYAGYEENFQKEVFISSVGIYSEDKTLIGIAKLSTPVRKRTNDSYTIKMKLDTI